MACVLDFPVDEADAFEEAARQAINDRLRLHQDLTEFDFWQSVAKLYARSAPEKQASQIMEPLSGEGTALTLSRAAL